MVDWPDTCKAIAERTKTIDMKRLIVKGKCKVKEKTRECAATCKLDSMRRVCSVWEKEIGNGKRMPYL